MSDKKKPEEIGPNILNLGTTPIALGAITIQSYLKYLDVDLESLMESLIKHSKYIKEGNLETLETMLMVQAHTLNAIFNKLALSGLHAESMKQFEPHLRLALKAQNQARNTIQTLANIKNPAPFAFVRQANIGYNQQVNNDGRKLMDASTEQKIEIPQNQLLEEKYGERLDPSTTEQTRSIDKDMETLGIIDRPKDRGWKG